MDIQPTDKILPLETAAPVKKAAENGSVSAAELKKAAEDFEAVFLKQFLGQALKPMLHKTLGSQAAGAGIYEHMITDVIAKNLSRGGDFGFSTMLQAQLMGAVQSEEKQDEPNLEDKSSV